MKVVKIIRCSTVASAVRRTSVAVWSEDESGEFGKIALATVLLAPAAVTLIVQQYSVTALVPHLGDESCNTGFGAPHRVMSVGVI